MQTCRELRSLDIFVLWKFVGNFSVSADDFALCSSSGDKLCIFTTKVIEILFSSDMAGSIL